ncbi:MAG: hypothetical protein DMG59_16715 [Acidobacteria bacterium]|nr:MAG: hypothetical protein DMG59_16715 [Acidobacteriota bacterium]
MRPSIHAIQEFKARSNGELSANPRSEVVPGYARNEWPGYGTRRAESVTGQQAPPQHDDRAYVSFMD